MELQYRICVAGRSPIHISKCHQQLLTIFVLVKWVGVGTWYYPGIVFLMVKWPCFGYSLLLLVHDLWQEHRICTVVEYQWGSIPSWMLSRGRCMYRGDWAFHGPSLNYCPSLLSYGPIRRRGHGCLGGSTICHVGWFWSVCDRKLPLVINQVVHTYDVNCKFRCNVNVCDLELFAILTLKCDGALW